jgi:hypothetical protein
MEHILISGTGRAGTTFLIIIFTLLNLDTGYNINEINELLNVKCNSGLEKGFKLSNKIVKSPFFIQNMEKVLSLTKIELMIIPIREFKQSAESRVKNGKEKGGLWSAKNFEEQLQFYHKIMAEYLYYMTKFDIPTVFIDFDKMISDSKYLYQKLDYLIKKYNITFEDFNNAFIKATLNQKDKTKIN